MKVSVYLKYLQTKSLTWLKRLAWAYGFLSIVCFAVVFVPNLEFLSAYLLPAYAVAVLLGLLVVIRYIKQVSQKLEFHEQSQEESLKRSQYQRLAGLNDLAGGIAHEINNPLAIIMGKAQTMRRRCLQGQMDEAILKDSVEKIESSVKRISRIVNALRSITRDNSAESPRWIFVSFLMDDIRLFWQQRLKSANIELITPPVDPRAKIYVRPSQMMNVFINLLSNSFHALSNQDGDKWIRIEFSEENSQVQFRVTDSGKGVPAQVRSRIFDAFFSTRPVNEGVGLGLTVAAAIVQQHGGKIYLEDSHPHTCFTITLPTHLPSAQVAA